MDADAPGTRAPPGPWAAALLLGLVLLAVWRWRAAGAPSGGDGAQYLAHAWALVQGRPYGDTGYLFTPAMWAVGPPSFPPGAPLALAPLLALFGPFGPAPLVLMHAFLLAFVALAGAYFAREADGDTGWGVAVLMAGAFLLADRANVVGSDLGFCAFVWGVLMLADRPGAWSWGRTVGITALGLAALLFRIAAAPLVPAAAAFALAHRRRVGWRALLPVAAWLGVLVYIVRGFGLGEGPGEMVTGGAATSERGVEATLRWLVGTLRYRVPAVQDAFSEAYLYPFPAPWANRAYHLAALGLTLVGLWTWLRRRPGALGIAFAAFTMLMLLVSPVWQSRYLWVLTPFMVFGLLTGLRALVSRWPSGSGTRRRAWAAATLFAALVVGGAALREARHPRPTFPPETETWREVGAALAEIRASRGSDSLRVASNRPRKVAWFTGVPAMPVLDHDLEGFLEEARRRGVSHMVVTAAVLEPERLARIRAWVEARPELFPLVREIGLVRVYEIRFPPDATPSPNR